MHSMNLINSFVYTIQFAGIFNRYLNFAEVLENLLTNKLH